MHGGDSPQALIAWTEGESFPGKWVCLTRHCEWVFCPDPVGLVRGVLSGVKGWVPGEAPLVSLGEAVRWCVTFLGGVPEGGRDFEKETFCRRVRGLSPVEERSGFTREQARGRLIIPSSYFLGRGFSAGVLDEFDVGEAREGSPYWGRAVAPVYSAGGLGVGCTARSVLPSCTRCHLHHAGACPKEEYGHLHLRWRNSRGLNSGRVLYNLHRALPAVRETGVVVLAEGPADVWRVHESGIPGVVGLFGAALSDGQQVLLEQSGARGVVVLTDNDDAGRLGAKEITNKLRRLFRVARPAYVGADPAEAGVEELRRVLPPLVEELGR